MFTISHPKIAGFTPRWSSFPGYSLLFDGPSDTYRRDGDLEDLRCGEQDLAFYAQAYETLSRSDLDRLLATYLFCALPPESYHVTAFDVANKADLTRCKGTHIDSLRDLLATPRTAEAFAHPILRDAETSDLANRQWGLAFRFAHLRIWGRVLAIELAPSGSDDEHRLAEILNARSVLHRTYLDRFGIGGSPDFTPHLSLGYFANSEGAELVSAKLPLWEAAMRRALDDLELPFETISLHGFTSMDKFFRRPKALD